MLEGGHQAHASTQDAVRRRAHQVSALLAEQTATDGETRLAKHVAKVNGEDDRFRREP
jgi:hypothetical protein